MEIHFLQSESGIQSEHRKMIIFWVNFEHFLKRSIFEGKIRLSLQQNLHTQVKVV